MTETKKTYVLKEAIDKAYVKFTELDDKLKTPVNMLLIAREFAPKTIMQVCDVVAEHPEVLAMEAKLGYQVVDVLIGTITGAIGTSMSDRYIEALQQAQGSVERNKLMIAGR